MAGGVVMLFLLGRSMMARVEFPGREAPIQRATHLPSGRQLLTRRNTPTRTKPRQLKTPSEIEADEAAAAAGAGQTEPVDEPNAAIKEACVKAAKEEVSRVRQGPQGPIGSLKALIY